MLNKLKLEVQETLNTKLDFIRNGQCIFNYIQQTYGIGYLIAEKYKVDCFYVDANIDAFLECVAYELESTEIVCISDLHGTLPTNLPSGHILIICGDITPPNIDKSLLKSTVWWATKFLSWAKSLSYEKIIFIAGNHDFLLQKTDCILDLIDPDYDCDKLVYLQDEPYSYRGIKFYGTPWVQELDKWAFYAPNNDLKIKFNEIPDDTDILITHEPPKIGNCGVILQSRHKKDCGSVELAEAISNKPNIKYSVFGHIHSGEHRGTKNEHNTVMYNVSLKDENYVILYEPLIIDYGKEIIKKRI
jgi:hypothetical protein